jgi:energy-coupling factor transporter transmembrane protein EcfT
MIITIFIILLIISLALITTAKALKQPPLALAGFLFLFILGLVLMIGGLEYVAGETETYGYTCSCCQEGTYTEGIITTYSCTGTPNTCDYYDLNQLDCIASGCTYNETTLSCDGTPSDCDTFTEERTCELVACYWEPNQESGCINGTSITIKNTTKENIYSAYDSEIVQGIQVNHLFGFFLCIIAIFGFVLTLTNLEAFEQKDAYEQYRRGQP